jgi:hypothetical protein
MAFQSDFCINKKLRKRTILKKHQKRDCFKEFLRECFMENRSGQNKRIDENRNNELKDRTFYGNVFHRNICWQRSYQRPEGEDMIMALYGSLRNGLYNCQRFGLQNQIADGHPTLKGRVCKGRPLLFRE